MKNRTYFLAIVICAVVAIGCNLLLARAGAPQQVWFFCHGLDLCKAQVQ
jgi:hypothetical protein